MESIVERFRFLQIDRLRRPADACHFRDFDEKLHFLKMARHLPAGSFASKKYGKRFIFDAS